MNTITMNRHIGLALITIGFLGGSLIAVVDKAYIDPLLFTPFLVLGAIGVLLVQLAIRRDATDTAKAQANFEVLHSSLGTIVDNLARLDRIKSEEATGDAAPGVVGDGDRRVGVYDLPEFIDHTFRDDIHDFVDARESIAHTSGMQAYADVMSHFAAGERYLNRVWSCAADGYVDEAHAFIGHSHEQFEIALTRLEALASVAVGEDDGASAGEDGVGVEADDLAKAEAVASKT